MTSTDWVSTPSAAELIIDDEAHIIYSDAEATEQQLADQFGDIGVVAFEETAGQLFLVLSDGTRYELKPL